MELKPKKEDLEKISFPTAGWRDKFPPEGRFTIENVCAVAFSFAKVVEENWEEFEKAGLKRKIIIGYDTRKGMKEYAEKVAECIRGFEIVMIEAPSPTPINVFTLKRERAALLINLTASHNPPDYGGIEAFDGRTLAIAHEDLNRGAMEVLRNVKEIPVERKEVKHISPPLEEYASYLKSIVDLYLAKKAFAIFDALHGTGYVVKDLARILGLNIQILHGNPDPDFGGLKTLEPSEEALKELAEAVVAKDGDVGLAGDGDLDRAGVVDEKGNWWAPNVFYPVILWYLLENGEYDPDRTFIVRTVPSTHWVDEIGKYFGMKNVVETKVGFRWVNEAIRDIESKGGTVILAFEESGGGRLPGAIPYKDGIAVDLKILEITGFLKEFEITLSEYLRKIEQKVGKYWSKRLNLRVENKEDAMNAIKNVFSEGAKKVITKDGFKYVFEDFWVCVRPAGTEPLLRIYLEAKSKDLLEKIEKTVRGVLDEVRE